MSKLKALLKKHNNSDPILLESLTNSQLLEIVDALQEDYWEEDSIIRILAEQFYGGNSVTQMLFVANKVLPVIADRLTASINHSLILANLK